MPDTVTLVLDAEQYHRELAKITAGNQRLGNSGEEIGRGFIRGDRAVRTATRNIVLGLSQVQDASSAAILTAQGLERVFKVGILPTVIVAAGLSFAEAISKMIERVVNLREEIIKLRSFSKLGGDFLSTESIEQNLTSITAQIKELQAGIVGRQNSLLADAAKSFLGPIGRAIIGTLNAADQEKINDLIKAAGDDVLELTRKQNDLNAALQDELDDSKDVAEQKRLEVDHMVRLDKLAHQVATAGLAGTEAARQLLEVENDRFRIEDAILRKKQGQAKVAEQTKSLGTAGGFFADLGSGAFTKNFFESQLRDIQTAQGQRFLQTAIEQNARDREAGRPLDPIFKAAEQLAQRLGVKAQTGINALINADFSNLLMLSKYDFSGLAPLNNLQIQIQ